MGNQLSKPGAVDPGTRASAGDADLKGEETTC